MYRMKKEIIIPYHPPRIRVYEVESEIPITGSPLGDGNNIATPGDNQNMGSGFGWH